MSKVWIVSEATEYGSDDVIAVYPSEELANAHMSLMGGYVEEAELRSELHPDAADPEKQAARVRDTDKRRAEWEAYRKREEHDAKVRAEVRPHPPHMTLCHCLAWGGGKNFINAHGYCSYCGGFTPTIFREHMGDAALHVEIDKLAINHRERMREIVATPD